jgi:hypothetical protein
MVGPRILDSITASVLDYKEPCRIHEGVWAGQNVIHLAEDCEASSNAEPDSDSEACDRAPRLSKLAQADDQLPAELAHGEHFPFVTAE